MLLLIVLFAFVAADRNYLERLPAKEAWTQWKETHQNYVNEIEYYGGEFQQRHQETFSIHHAKVRLHNEKYDAGEETFWLNLNKFAAMPQWAFDKAYKGYQGGKVDMSNVKILEGDVPDSKDWRDSGAVNPVKNQGGCGSCWAFSTIASLEGMYQIAGNKLTSFSEQNLVDCVKKQTITGSSQTCCDGCQGGLMNYAYEYMIDHQDGKAATESSYSYKGRNGSCEFSSADKMSGATISSYSAVKPKDEDQLKTAVATKGVIAIAVNAGGFWWQLYGGGIFKHRCNGDASKLDHGVAVVGYAPGYWIVRNSWGAGWGEHGYIRLESGNNECGVATEPFYPELN